MPNHVTNIIKLNGDRKQISEFLKQIQNDEHGLGTIDFEKIIPMPENIYRGNLGREETNLYGKTTGTTGVYPTGVRSGQPMAMRKTVITQTPKNCAS